MKKLVILSGAGLSAESGLSTFRDKDGLWEKHRVEEICNIHTWRYNYELVHRFYNERRTQLGTVQPNVAHQQIARWESIYPTILLTQNVDDLLERGGCREVAHLHGFLIEMQCTACGGHWTIGYTEWSDTDRCPRLRCRSRAGVKPNVVFFGESAPMYTFLSKTMKCLQADDVLLVIGTTGTVLPVDCMARHAPCTTILNNLAPSEFIDAANFDHVFYEPATQAVRKIDRLLKEALEK